MNETSTLFFVHLKATSIHVLTMPCSRSCSSCPGSCRRTALSNIVSLDFSNLTYSLNSSGVGLAPLTFTVNCLSNVNIQFAGTLYNPLYEGAISQVVTMKLQYVNAAIPSLYNPVAIPLNATVAVGAYVPFTAVQTVQLTPGTYVANLVLSVAGVTPPTTVAIAASGTMSAFIVTKSA